MSGHSKWSSIKHKKGAADAKRGALFTKLARAIQVAGEHVHAVAVGEQPSCAREPDDPRPGDDDPAHGSSLT